MPFLVLTYSPDDLKADGERSLQRLLDEYRVFGHAVSGWGTTTKEGVEPGTLAVAIAARTPGLVVSLPKVKCWLPPFRAKANPNSSRADWLIVAVYLWKAIDPRSEPFLYDAAAWERMGST